MGTSKNYSPPTATTWNPRQAINDGHISGTGHVVKETAFSFLGDYVRANGGAARMAASGGAQGSGMAGQRSALALGGFISDVAGRGLESALQNLDLEYLVEHSAEEILYGLVDRLAGPSSTIDDEDARNAQACLLEELLSGASTANDIESVLSEIVRNNQFESLLKRFFSLYLNEQFCRTHCGDVTKRLGGQEANNFFDEIKAYIREEFELRVDGRNLLNINWTGEEGKRLCQSVMEQTLQTFEECTL